MTDIRVSGDARAEGHAATIAVASTVEAAARFVPTVLTNAPLADGACGSFLTKWTNASTEHVGLVEACATALSAITEAVVGADADLSGGTISGGER